MRIKGNEEPIEIDFSILYNSTHHKAKKRININFTINNVDR